MRRALSLSCLLSLLASTALPAKVPAAPASQPETLGQAAFTRHAMVAAANPLAVEAGVTVLKAGGSAVDAAVAIQTVLGLVEPQSSGLGGGSFMLYYDAKTRKVTAYDGREMAPGGATSALFLDDNGKPLPFFDAVLGGRSTGTPGAIAMLEMAHKDHGKLPWASLFTHAETLANDGFIVSPRLAGMIAATFPQDSAPDVVRYFTKPDGTRYVAGDRLKNAAYAETLGLIAREGAAGLLSGKVAQDIIDRVHQGPLPSTMTLADLAAYRPSRTEALCRPYRTRIVCTPQAPSGGPGLQVALGILADTDIAHRNAGDPKAWFEFAQASRLAYADRDRYVGDPAFVTVPVEGMLDPAYLAERAKLVGDHAGPVSFGQPRGAPAVTVADSTAEPGGTSHMVIVDADGNAVSMTTTVESIFGSGRMVDGFFLNNQLTDFSFSPTQPDGTAAANAPAPHKRPRSTMAPTIVLDRDGSFYASAGSPGGSAIQSYNLKALVGILDWKMTPQAAVSLPNLVAHGDSYTADPFSPAITQGLAGMGITLSTGRGENSGLQAIVRRPDGYEGGADPRREGVARGF
jgi:gamma-glutamyltranspeptidase/glutathione hydrolase